MYSRTFWQDHITDSQGAVIQQGTAMNQEHFNNIEKGVFEAQVTQDLGAIMQRLNADEARNAQPYVMDTQTLVPGTNTVSFPTDKSRNATVYAVIPVLRNGSNITVSVSALQKNGFTVSASSGGNVSFTVIGGLL